MSSVLVTFSDGKTKRFESNDMFRGMSNFDGNPVLTESFVLWEHNELGLVPSFMEMTMNCLYFCEFDNPSVFYNSSSVIKIEVV
ncbi:hypothetical protein K7G42_07050 [Streptococcus parauberis]|uniref:hypothetical protein n=1 Tax=Streptococcus parauberis TaxID=1348 RepID=UPI00056C0A5D|nr:hypothetical protein [Streptococcus parauberis]WEM64343.1 hypothetical protein P1T45_06770 [Streptococcus parauberis]WOF46170.1 hypothetical protein K7G42_07050 [Streptococcus parauberis]